MKRYAAFLTALLLVWAVATPLWAGEAYQQGMSERAKGNYGEAIKSFKQELKADPDNLDAMRMLGDCYYHLGKRPEAITALEAVLEKDPGDKVALDQISQVYQWDNQLENAISAAERRVELEPNNVEALIRLQEIYAEDVATYALSIKTGKKALELAPENEQSRLLLARVHSWSSRYRDAIVHYEKLLDRNPKNKEARYEYANCLAYDGRYDESIVQYKILLPDSHYRDRSYHGLAAAYAYGQRFTDSILTYRYLLEKNPNDIKVRKGYAAVLATQNRTDEAIAEYNKILEIDPDNVEVMILLANLYRWDEKHRDDCIRMCRKVLQLQPGNREIGLLLVQTYVDAGNPQAAQEQLQAMIQQDSENGELLLTLADIYAQSGDYTAAIGECGRILKLKPGNRDARLAIAKYQSEMGEFEDSFDTYEELIDEDETDTRAALGLAWAYHLYSIQAHDRSEELRKKIQAERFAAIDRVRWFISRIREVWYYNKSIHMLEGVIEKNPDDTEANLLLAEIFGLHDSYEEALTQYQEVVRKDPRSVEAYLGMAWIYGLMGNQGKSIEAIQKAANIEPSNIQVLYSLGEAYEAQEDVSKAIRTIERALVLKHDEMSLHRKLAFLYATDHNYYNKGIEKCNLVLSKNPDDHEIRHLLAKLYSWKEMWPESIEQYEILLKRDPDNQAYYTELIKVRIYEGRTQESVEELKAALEKEPNRTELRLALALAYMEQGLYDEAEKEYNIILENEPHNALVHIGLGDLYRLTGKYEKAMIAYREVLATEPNNPAAHYGIGVIYRKRGQLEEAAASQERVLAADPNNINAFVELSYTHYLMSRRYIARTGEYRRAWWLLSNTMGDIYGIRGDYPEVTRRLHQILEEDPCNTDILFLLAKEYENHGRNQEAVRYYRQLLKCNPNHGEGRLALAELYSYDRRTYDDAINQTLILLKSDPENFDLHLSLARLYSWKRNFNKSVAHYRWCLSKKPDNRTVRFELAQVYTYQNKYDSAIRELQIILAIEPDNIEARMQLARLYAYQGKYDLAMREYEIILQKDPNNYTASYALAELYSWDRRYYHRAIDLYGDMAARHPDQVDPILEVARMHYERGELDKAEKAYRQAISMHPDEVEPRMAAGRVYYGMGRYDDATEQFMTVLRMDENNIEAHYYMAKIYALEEDKYHLSIQECRLVLTKEPDNNEIRLLLARLLAFDERYGEAAEELEKVASSSPEDEEILMQLAQAYSYAENHERSVEIYQKILEKNPDNKEAMVELGVSYTFLDRFAEAVDTLGRVVELDPWNVRARRFLARSYDASGDVPGAVDQYKRILLIDDNDQEAREYLEGHGIDISDRQALLDSFYGGEVMLAAGPPSRAAPDRAGQPPPGERMGDDEQAYRLRVAEEMSMRARYQGAIRQYRKLVKEQPDNPYYHMALGNVYRWSGQWRQATLEYERVLELEPDHLEAKEGLAAIYRETAPVGELFLGHGMAMRFNDKVGYIMGGGRFIYRFWNNSLVSGEVKMENFWQEDLNPVFSTSPRIYAMVNLIVGLEVHAGYTYNMYGRLPNTHNWEAGLSGNIFDYVIISLDYKRTDIGQTIASFEEGIQEDIFRGKLEIIPIDRLKAWGLYEYGIWYEGDDILDGVDNVSNLIMAGANYRFMNNPSLTVGYMYTWLTYDDQIPYLQEVYWSPDWFTSHALPIELNHQVLEDLFYYIGVSPAINRERGADWNWSLAFWGGLLYEINWQNELEFRADCSFSETDWAYNLLLLYRHRFAFKKMPNRQYYDEIKSLEGDGS